jgi:NitT/TauT family transport system permease protein
VEAHAALPRGRVGSRRALLGPRARLWLGWLAVPLVLMLIWVLSASSSDLVPSLGSTVSMLGEGFTNGWIWTPLVDSMSAVLGGFVIAAAIGLPLGIALGRSRFLGSVLDPLIAGTFAIPRIILYPVLLAYFGVGVSAKLWMAAISAFFPIVMNTTAGIREVSPTLVKMGRSMSCGPLQLARKIYLPAAAPTVAVGLRIGFSISFISVIIAELFASAEGLGRVVKRAYAFQQLPRMYSVVLLIALIAFAGNLILWTLERRLRATVD